MENLERNNQDLIAIVGKSIVGVIPIIGPLLSEIVGTVIPNQRIDRLIKYVNVLNGPSFSTIFRFAYYLYIPPCT